LALIWTPIESLNWGGVAEALAQEGELVQSLQTVDIDFICFCAERHEFSGWANLEVCHFVRIWDLGYWLRLIAVPEKDGAARATSHEFQLVVPSLAHSCVEAVRRLAHLSTLLLLEVVSANGTVGAARVDYLRLCNVRE
jgi:hypothetical protein